MPRYLTNDGLAFEAATAPDVIDALRHNSLTPGRDRSHFLTIIAEGATMQTGQHVRATDCETTLADLIAVGLVQRIDK